MWAYIFRRLLFFIPTILVVSLITFGLSRMVPGDPISLIMGEEISSLEERPGEYSAWLEEYQLTASQYRLDKPTFYFSILPSNYPDTLSRVLPIARQKHLRSLLHEFGDWALINRYAEHIETLHDNLITMVEKPNNYTAMNSLVNQLGRVTQKNEIKRILEKLQLEQSKISPNYLNINQLEQVFKQMTASPRAAFLLPKFIWYGTENQYHYWFIGLLKGDLGKSIVDKKDVGSKIMDALPKTLILNFLALIVALFFGFLLGVYLATHSQSWLSKLLLSEIYAVLAIPSFWLASLLVIFLTTSDYGAWTNIFPSEGFGKIPVGVSFFQKVSIRLSHLTLPVLSIAIPLVGVLALQLRRSLMAEMKKPYIKTAILKGISERRVIWTHGVRNAMFPVLTMFGSILPAMIGGSVAIELIFNIPGMGQLLLHSIYGKDWSVVFGVLMLTAILTIASLLLMDILYAHLNPKVGLKLNKTNE